jgi:serine/threonine-protein kinase
MDSLDSCAPPAARLSIADPRLGTCVGEKWRLDRVLGAGGAAVVYAATHRNGNVVAIKILRPHLVGDPDLVGRFTREGHVGNRIAGPGVVRTLDDGTTEDGLPFLVMEMLRGESLAERIATQGRLSTGEAVRILDAVLAVLALAHAVGLVHRDIKPENVFLTEEGGVKLLDFGIAGVRGLHTRGETLAGTVLGTPAFMPPEQARGHWQEVDARSDLWAAGATFFRMVTGRYLREAGNAVEELTAALCPLAPMVELAPDVPQAFGAFLDKALAHDPGRRFVDALAMRVGLREAAMSAKEDERPAEERETGLPATPFVWPTLRAWLHRHGRRALLIAAASAIGAFSAFASCWGRPRAPAALLQPPPLADSTSLAPAARPVPLTLAAGPDPSVPNPATAGSPSPSPSFLLPRTPLGSRPPVSRPRDPMRSRF